MTTKKKMNGASPATQEDLSMWGGRLQEQIDDVKNEVKEVKQDVRDLRQDVGRLERGFKTLLSIAEDNNRLLKELRYLPEKVQRIHDKVFPRR